MTNLTAGQVFSPLLVVIHNPKLHLFQLGRPATAELVALAEEGDPVPLRTLLDDDPNVGDVRLGHGPIPPGGSFLGDQRAAVVFADVYDAGTEYRLF